MNLDDLRRRRATLETLRLDLPSWNVPGDFPPESAPVPIVAIDWSEIFCYVMCEAPREEGGEDLFAAHYAGLNYLLFKLRCRPVLLPPYHAEMATFIQMLETRAIAPIRKSDIDHLNAKYDDLLGEIRDLQRKYPAFSDAIDGDSKASERLPAEAWDFLENLLKDSVPSIYLDVQQTTLSAMQALSQWLRAKGESGENRVWPLGALKILSKRACEDSLGGWHDWNAEMDSQRPRMERQNRADALALAYLQALHQASYWNNVPVYFASRSLSMLQVMENHAGEFEPYRHRDGDGRSAVRSSWRSWDYFAELGYYAGEYRSADSPARGNSRAEVEQDLIVRIAKLDQCIGLATRGSKERASFSGWETLRGSFDLEGMGGQPHWKRIRVKQPRMARMIDVLSSVLSAESSQVFIARRAALARNILSEIGLILGSLPPDIQLPNLSDSNVDSDETASLTKIVWENLKVSALFEEYSRQTECRDGSQLMESALTLLKSLAATDSAAAMNAARELLQLFAEPAATSSFSAGSRDWLVGVAFFFRSFYDDSLNYLPSWLETQATVAKPALALVTRALCADAWRFRRVRDYDQGIRLLLNVRLEDLTSFREVLIWHCLKGQMLIEWMAHAGEHDEIYPKPGGQSGESAVLRPMIDPVAECIRNHDELGDGLRMQAASTVLMLAGRYIPENLPFLNEEERDRKLSWLLEKGNTSRFEKIEQWCRIKAEREGSASLFHTLGYFNVKMALVDQRHWGQAKRFLEEAARLAVLARDLRTQRLVAAHLAWAWDHLEGHS